MTTLYRTERLVAGVVIRCRPRVTNWEGWPDDVRETLRRWNKAGRLSFYNEATWGGFFTGFECLTEKCFECGCFFNQHSACWLRNGSKENGRWVCDDCIVALARET